MAAQPCARSPHLWLRKPGVLLLSVAALTLLSACARPEAAGQRVERLRARYQVKVTGWIVDQPATAAAVTPTEALTAPPAVEVETPEGSGLVVIEPVQNVHLDLEIQHDSPDKLPGLTVEVVQTDSLGREKAHHRLWLEVAALQPGAPTRTTHLLPEIPYTVGDVFTTSIRGQVPEPEWPLYKEFPLVP
jgi:hypothetical protein